MGGRRLIRPEPFSASLKVVRRSATTARDMEM